MHGLGLRLSAATYFSGESSRDTEPRLERARLINNRTQLLRTPRALDRDRKGWRLALGICIWQARHG